MLAEFMSSPEPTGRSGRAGALRAETVAALHEAIRRRVVGAPQNGDLRDALQTLSREARSNGLRCEHVIIVLKQLWSELPEVWQGLAAQDQRRMLGQLVTLCIEEFYGQE